MVCVTKVTVRQPYNPLLLNYESIAEMDEVLISLPNLFKHYNRHRIAN